MKIPKFSIDAVNANKDAELIDANNDRPADSHRESLMSQQETEHDECEDIQPANQTKVNVTQERNSLQSDHNQRT